MQALLRVIQKQANIQQVRLLPETVIGRSVDCNLKIASTQVSRRHCRIVVNDAGVFIEDLCSANGTFLDGQRLLPNQLTLAPAGSQLVIGPATFAVEYRTAVISRPELGASLPAKAPETIAELTEETAAIPLAEVQAVFASNEVSDEPSESVFAGLVTDPAEPLAIPAPVQEPPKRLRSLFGLFRRGQKADAKSVPPFLPTEAPSAPVEDVASEAPQLEETAEEEPSTVVADEFPINFGDNATEAEPADEADNPFRQFSQY